MEARAYHSCKRVRYAQLPVNPKPYSRHYLLRYDAYGRNHKRGRGRSKRDELAPVNAGDAARPKQPFSYMRGYRNAREKNPYRW
jgi:hypothetical protein